MKYKPVWSHHWKCYPNFGQKIVLDRAECQISGVSHITLNASWSHFIVFPEWSTMLIVQLCSHTAFGKANSNMLRLNIYVVSQGDEMTQLWSFTSCLLCHHHSQSNPARLWTSDYGLQTYTRVKESGLMIPNTKNLDDTRNRNTRNREISANKSVHKIRLCLWMCVQIYNVYRYQCKIQRFCIWNHSRYI